MAAPRARTSAAARRRRRLSAGGARRAVRWAILAMRSSLPPKGSQPSCQPGAVSP